MNTKGKIIAAAVAGIAAGSVLGVLFAPNKGKDTRKKIKDKANDLAESVKNIVDKGKEKLHHLQGKTTDEAIDKIEPLS
jgi:gas vesicle protein